MAPHTHQRSHGVIRTHSETLRTLATGERQLSVDILRGVLVAWLVAFVSPAGGQLLSSLDHAAWHGWRLADLGLPGFLAIMGVAIPLATAQRALRGHSRPRIVYHALSRAGVLIALGLLLNAAPFITFSPDLGWHENLRTLRIPGVLQRIGICYLVCVGLYLYVRPAVWVGVGVALLVTYAFALVYVPVPGYGAGQLDIPHATLPAYIDRLLFGDHLWITSGRQWDPAGLLSTTSSVTTTLVGVWVGHRLLTPSSKRKPICQIAGAGLLLAVGGLLWGTVLPINKPLWTPSYSLFMGGLFLLAYALTYYVVEIQGWKAWAHPFKLLGINAITIYVLVIAAMVVITKVPLLGGHTPNQVLDHVGYLLGLPRPLVLALRAVVWLGLAYICAYTLYRYRYRVSCTGVYRLEGGSSHRSHWSTAHALPESTGHLDDTRRPRTRSNHRPSSHETPGR